MTEDTRAEVTCPKCSTVIDTTERCERKVGLGQCFENQGHEGWHWTQVSEGIMRWTGLFILRHACPGRLSLSDWCQLAYGHDGSHNNGRGTSFSEVEDDAA